MEDVEGLVEHQSSIPNHVYMHSYDAEHGAMVVHIDVPELRSKGPPMHRLQSYEEKPAKKQRTAGSTGGGFLSRLLNNGQQRLAAC
jgi:hypothetical protein